MRQTSKWNDLNSEAGRKGNNVKILAQEEELLNIDATVPDNLDSFFLGLRLKLAIRPSGSALVSPPVNLLPHA